MDVAELRAIYTATSAEFDRVTDHVQRRLKETQAVASGAGKGGQSQATKEAANVQLGILKSVEQGRQAFVKSQIEAVEKGAAASIASTKAVTEVERQAANVRMGFLRTFETGRQEFVGSQIKAAEAEAKGIIGALQKEATARKQVASVRLTTTAVDMAAFWEKQRQGAQSAARTVETETKRAASTVTATWLDAGAREENIRRRTAAKGTAIVTGAAATQRTTIKGVAAEVEKSTNNISTALTSLFIRNNFLFRQLGQRVAGDLGFAAVGVTKLGINLGDLITRQHGAISSQQSLNAAFLKFEAIIASVARGRNKAAGDIFGILGIDALKGLRAPEEAFAKFLAGFRRITNESDRAALAATLFGKDAIKLLPALEATAIGATGAAGGLGTLASGYITTATSAATVIAPVAAVVALFAAVELAAIAAGFGLFSLAKSVAASEEKFEDFHQQTGLSIENLYALDIAAKQSSSTLPRLVNSVGQLERKLIDASEGGTSRLSAGLRKLGIDADDPNKALAQLFDLLAKLPAGTVRTGAAIQIFGRNGRELAAVVGQVVQRVGSADGVLERFKKSLEDSGATVRKDGVRTAAEFHDQMVLLSAQFENFKRIAGEEALPSVLRVATQFSNWIATNRVELGNWAKDLERTAEKVVEFGVNLLKLAKIGPIVIPIVGVVEFIRHAGGEITQAGRDLIGRLPAGLREQAIIAAGSAAASVGGGAGGRGPQAPEPVRGQALFTPSSTADEVAKKIRDAFAQRGRGGRGQDPAEVARRLTDIYLQETLKGLQAERDALDRSLQLNLISRDRYTAEAVNLEVRRRRETIAGLQTELAEAERIRKPGQRAIRVAEINARIKEEERRAAKEVTEITDESAAEQLRIGQSLSEASVRIIETQTERMKARFRELADFRIITEQQAAEFEEQHILRVFNARRRLLEQELRDAGANAEKRTEAQNKLNQLEADRANFVEESSRRISAAIRNDAEHLVRFTAQVRDAFARAADVRLQAREMDLEPLRNSILTRHQLWDAELRFEVERELDRHNAVIKGFEDEAALARIRILNAKELADTLRGIRAQEIAEEEVHQARLRQLATQAAEQRRQELLQVANDLSAIANDIFAAIGKSSTEFWKSLTQTASNFARQIGQELFKGLLQRAITGQAEGAEGLVGAIINPLLGAGQGPQAALINNTDATRENTEAINTLTRTMGGVSPAPSSLAGVFSSLGGLDRIFGIFGGGGGTARGSLGADLSSQILNLGQAQGILGSKSEDIRLNVAVGQDAVDEMIEAQATSPKGRRQALLRAKYNRKLSKLLFA